MRKIRTSMALSAKQRERLSKEAEALGITMGDLLRRIIDRYFEPKPTREVIYEYESTGER